MKTSPNFDTSQVTSEGIKDIYDERNIIASELEIVGSNIPEEFDFSQRLSIVQDQKKSGFRPFVACGPHGQSMCLDTYELEVSSLWKNGEGIARDMDKIGMFHEWGSYLLDHAKYPKQIGIIKGYFIARTYEQMKAHLYQSKGGAIVGTNSMAVAWNIERGRFEWQEGAMSGHLFTVLPKCDKNGVWTADSWGGRLVYLPARLYDRLFPSRICFSVDEKFTKIQTIRSEALTLIKRAEEIYPNLPEPARFMRIQKALERRHGDKKLVQVGWRLARNMNIPKGLL